MQSTVEFIALSNSELRSKKAALRAEYDSKIRVLSDHLEKPSFKEQQLVIMKELDAVHDKILVLNKMLSEREVARSAADLQKEIVEIGRLMTDCHVSSDYHKLRKRMDEAKARQFIQARMEKPEVTLDYSKAAFAPGGIFRTDQDIIKMMTKFEIKVDSRGHNNPGALDVTLTNHGLKRVRFEIPDGALFEPSDRKDQNLIVKGGKSGFVEPGQTVDFKLFAFCGNSNKCSPSSEMSLTGFIYVGPLDDQRTVWSNTDKYKA
jgi:hypothetical protein